MCIILNQDSPVVITVLLTMFAITVFLLYACIEKSYRVERLEQENESLNFQLEQAIKCNEDLNTEISILRGVNIGD